MIRILFIFALALLPEGLFAQSAGGTEHKPEFITKVIRVHYGDPQTILRILRDSGQPVHTASDDALKALVLNGRLSDVANVEQIIKELDAPPVVSTTGDIELIVHVIAGSDEAMTSSNNDVSTIEPVVKQLRAIFPYKHYAPVTTMFMRSQQGKSGENSGLIQYPFAAKDPFPTNYQIKYDTATVSSDKSRPAIHLKNFEFNSVIGVYKASAQSTETGQMLPLRGFIKSDLNLPIGQTVVVGNTNVAGNSALFIALSAKLVD